VNNARETNARNPIKRGHSQEGESALLDNVSRKMAGGKIGGGRFLVGAKGPRWKPLWRKRPAKGKGRIRSTTGKVEKKKRGGHRVGRHAQKNAI